MHQKLSLISATINAIGILLGVIGSFLIWRHGVPPADIEEDTLKFLSNDDKNVAESKAKHLGKSKCGMMCLFISFALQLASVLISIGVLIAQK